MNSRVHCTQVLDAVFNSRNCRHYKTLAPKMPKGEVERRSWDERSRPSSSRVFGKKCDFRN